MLVVSLFLGTFTVEYCVLLSVPMPEIMWRCWLLLEFQGVLPCFTMFAQTKLFFASCDVLLSLGSDVWGLIINSNPCRLCLFRSFVLICAIPRAFPHSLVLLSVWVSLVAEAFFISFSWSWLNWVILLNCIDLVNACDSWCFSFLRHCLATFAQLFRPWTCLMLSSF